MRTLTFRRLYPIPLVCFVLLLSLVSVGLAVAQSAYVRDNAVFNVHDQSGAPIPNAEIRVVPITSGRASILHTHVVLGRPDGSTVGGHVWELHVNPTLEVFVTANTTPLKKKPDDASGIKLIDPTE